MNALVTKIDREWLKKNEACEEGKEWFLRQGILDPLEGLKNLIKHHKLEWAGWLIVRVMTKTQCLAYAIFAAEQTLSLYEEKNPEDKKPRFAIEAAKNVLKNDKDQTRHAAMNAGYAPSADAAAFAADAAAIAARTAADAAGNATGDAMKITILNFGLSLLERRNRL